MTLALRSEGHAGRQPALSEETGLAVKHGQPWGLKQSSHACAVAAQISCLQHPSSWAPDLGTHGLGGTYWENCHIFIICVNLMKLPFWGQVVACQKCHLVQMIQKSANGGLYVCEAGW